MTIDEQIQEQLQMLVKREATFFPAEVISVDKDKMTIAVKDGLELEYPDVRLTAAVEASNTLVCIPSVGSSVLVQVIGEQENELVAMRFSEVDEIHMKGNQYSLVKAEELKTVLDLNKAFIDALKGVITGVPIVEPGNGAPSELQRNLALALGNLNWGDHSQIINDKVKHS